MTVIYYFILVIALFAVLALVLRITFFLVKEAEVVEIDLSEIEES